MWRTGLRRIRESFHHKNLIDKQFMKVISGDRNPLYGTTTFASSFDVRRTAWEKTDLQSIAYVGTYIHTCMYEACVHMQGGGGGGGGGLQGPFHCLWAHPLVYYSTG